MKKKKEIDKPIGLELNENKIDSSETEIISTENLPIEEEHQRMSIPWAAIIISGILVILIIVCLIVIFAFGGPV